MTVTGLNVGTEFQHRLSVETSLSTGQEKRQREEQKTESRKSGQPENHSVCQR